ncbi:hypothetical protein QYM36_020062, partial [Artemia franciscana]
NANGTSLFVRTDLTGGGALMNDTHQITDSSFPNGRLHTLQNMPTYLNSMNDGGVMEESLKGEVDDTDGECNNSRSNGGTPPTCDEHLTKAFVCVSRGLNNLSVDPTEEIDESFLPILPDSAVAFPLSAPERLNVNPTIQHICESASRLLFLTVYWIKSVPMFSSLSEDVQVALLRNSWAEMFILAMAQRQEELSVHGSLMTLLGHLQTLPNLEFPERIKELSKEIVKIYDIVANCVKLELDDSDYGYLKLVVLLNPVLLECVQFGMSFPLFYGWILWKQCRCWVNVEFYLLICLQGRPWE